MRAATAPPATEPAAAAAADDTSEASEAEPVETPAAEAAPPPNWPDDTVESAFRAEARERGETVVAASLPAEAIEEAAAGPLPPLDELVQRIPPRVRETLDDLFRVKFTTVRRVPGKALKG